MTNIVKKDIVKNWELFEKNSVQYLRNNINYKDIIVEESGSYNSRETDIKVLYKKNLIFSIESKNLPSQCGQFVVELNNGKLIESRKNFSINKYSKLIVDQLNFITSTRLQKFSYLKLSLKHELMFNWIREHYCSKGVKFFIVSKQINSNFKLIRVDELNKYFTFSCTIRRKKSGSRDVSKSKRKEAIINLIRHLNKFENKILNQKIEGKSTIISTSKQVLDKYFCNRNYFLSKLNNNEYKIKQLSSTNNLSVIFSIDYNTPPKNNGLSNLTNSLNEFSC